MKTKLAHIFVAILASVTLGVARADDAATTKKLVGYWKADTSTYHYKADGTVDDLPLGKGRPTEKWYVRDGILHVGHNSYKILSLTDSKLAIQDEAHGRGTGELTKVTAAEAKK
jgi:hypothetical protein